MPYAEEPPVRGRAPLLDTSGLAAPPLPVVADDPEGPSPTSVVGESPPEHTWLGTGFVWTLYLAAAWSLILPAVVARGLVAEEDGGYAGQALMVVWIVSLSAIPAIALVGLARAVQAFRQSGLGMSMLLLFVMLIGGVRTLADADTLLDGVLGGGTLAMAATWMRYFMSRAEDFTDPLAAPHGSDSPHDRRTDTFLPLPAYRTHVRPRLSDPEGGSDEK